MTGTCHRAARRARPAGLGLAAVLALATSAAHADSLVVQTDNGTPQTTDGVTNIATDGADMVGSLVTAFFDNGSSQTLPWQATGATSGGVQGTGWSLSQIGDSFGGDWTLTNISAAGIIRFLFDGGPGRTLFDIVAGATGTPNSANGQPFTRVAGGTNRDIAVTYRDRVAITGQAPAGDLYRQMDVQFNAPGGAILAGSPSLVFESDTDNATTDVIPEPSSGLLMLAGLGAVLARRRRPRRPE